jgi:hypothetical protein
LVVRGRVGLGVAIGAPAALLSLVYNVAVFFT